MIDKATLGAALRRFRHEHVLSLRDVEDECGVSASTLSRIEHEKGNPDADTIIRLAQLLKLPVERVVKSDSNGQPQPVIYFPNESTPEIVHVHLCADQKLTPETAKALSDLFRVAYAAFAKKGK